jgi:hypothetical protein
MAGLKQPSGQKHQYSVNTTYVSVDSQTCLASLVGDLPAMRPQSESLQRPYSACELVKRNTGRLSRQSRHTASFETSDCHSSRTICVQFRHTYRNWHRHCGESGSHDATTIKRADSRSLNRKPARDWLCNVKRSGHLHVSLAEGLLSLGHLVGSRGLRCD